MEDIFNVAIENGAIGGKACGAGGGGCILFYCTPNQDHLVRKALGENGVTIIDFNFDFSGLKGLPSITSINISCVSNGISPISSKNTVPPSASFNIPV